MDITQLSPTTIWATLGLLLILVEAFTSSFFVLFFGISALVVAVCKLFGFNNFNGELLIFAIGGVLGVLSFRKKVTASFKNGSPSTLSDQNREIILTHTVHKNSEAKIEYQGTTWTAVNPTAQDMPKGTKVVIAKTESTKLILKHIN